MLQKLREYVNRLEREDPRGEGVLVSRSRIVAELRAMIVQAAKEGEPLLDVPSQLVVS